MARILDKTQYPLDTNVTKDDYVIGTDFDQNLKTVNFNIGSIIRLIQSELNFSSAEFRFSTGEDPEITYDSQGFFFTGEVTGDPDNISKLYFNKLNIAGQDLTGLLGLAANNAYTFGIKLINSGDPSSSFYFRITGGTDQGNYYEFDVEVIGDNYFNNLQDLSTYNVFLEVFSSQDNKNLVKQVVVAGEKTDQKIVDGINALAQFSVSDTQNVYYEVTDDNGKYVYVLKDKGKGTYGTGGIEVVTADLQMVSNLSGSGSGDVVTTVKDVTVNGTYDDTSLLAAINGLASYDYGANEVLFFKVVNGNRTYVYITEGLASGTYGTGETQITIDKLKLVSIIGNGIINVVKTASITGELTGAKVAAAINALTTFDIGVDNNVYFKVATDISATTYVYVIKGKGAGTYGSGGTQIADTDLELISVITASDSWSLRVDGIEKKVVTLGEFADFKGLGYVSVTYNDEEDRVEIDFTQQFKDLIASFKPIIPVTEAQHQALIDGGGINPNAIYVTVCQ